MTIIELCNQIEEAMKELGPEVLAPGWRWMKTAPQEDTKHVEEYRAALEMTREHFKTEGPQSLYGVWCAEADAFVCNCGPSPLSNARARYLMMCQPEIMKVFIETIRSAQRMADDVGRLTEEAKKDCYIETPMTFTVPGPGLYSMGVDYGNGSDECTAAILKVGETGEPDVLVTILRRDKESGQWKEDGK